jgi:hypothetical protein
MGSAPIGQKSKSPSVSPFISPSFLSPSSL